VTSFNEWGEGTQIEPVQQQPPQAHTKLPSDKILVVPETQDSATAEVDLSRRPAAREYQTYGELGSQGYLDRTALWAARLKE